MRLIAERVLADADGKTYVDKEISSSKLKPLPPPRDGEAFHVIVSGNNPGAMALLQEVAGARGFRLVDSAYDTAARRHKPEHNVLHVASTSTKASPVSSSNDLLTASHHFLLYLNAQVGRLSLLHARPVP